MENHAFSGERPIEVLQFLSAFKTTCDGNDIPEGAAVLTSKFLTGALNANSTLIMRRDPPASEG